MAAAGFKFLTRHAGEQSCKRPNKKTTKAFVKLAVSFRHLLRVTGSLTPKILHLCFIFIFSWDCWGLYISSLLWQQGKHSFMAEWGYEPRHLPWQDPSPRLQKNRPSSTLPEVLTSISRAKFSQPFLYKSSESVTEGTQRLIYFSICKIVGFSVWRAPLSRCPARIHNWKVQSQPSVENDIQMASQMTPETLSQLEQLRAKSRRKRNWEPKETLLLCLAGNQHQKAERSKNSNGFTQKSNMVRRVNFKGLTMTLKPGHLR